MTRDEFIELEYPALRDEILAKQVRTFRILTLSVPAIPAAVQFGVSNDLLPLLFAIPVVVVAVGFFYLAENHAIIRCAQYIRLNIEAKVSLDPGAAPASRGWEHWLESNHGVQTRLTETYTAWVFSLLLGMYYVLSVAVVCLKSGAPPKLMVGAIAIYGVIGALAGWQVFRSLRFTTNALLGHRPEAMLRPLRLGKLLHRLRRRRALRSAAVSRG